MARRPDAPAPPARRKIGPLVGRLSTGRTLRLWRVGGYCVRLVLLVEGWTEKELPAFLKRWLDPQLPRPIGIHAVRLPGAPNFVNNVAKRVRSHLTHEEDTIAVFGLL